MQRIRVRPPLSYTEGDWIFLDDMVLCHYLFLLKPLQTQISFAVCSWMCSSESGGYDSHVIILNTASVVLPVPGTRIARTENKNSLHESTPVCSQTDQTKSWHLCKENGLVLA